MPITREQLEKEAPELIAQIREEGRSEAQTELSVSQKDDARGEGVSQERTRVVKILEAGGDNTITLQAIKDGIKASDTFESLFRAEKKKRVHVLDEMESDATDTVGAEIPEDPEKPDNRRPDEILAEKAKALAADKGISYADAQEQVMASTPKLAEAIRKGLVE